MKNYKVSDFLQYFTIIYKQKTNYKHTLLFIVIVKQWFSERGVSNMF